MSPTAVVVTDRFGRAYQTGARIVYPTRRGSYMELIEARITGVETEYGQIVHILATRNNGTKVTLRNVWDVVVVPE